MFCFVKTDTSALGRFYIENGGEGGSCPFCEAGLPAKGVGTVKTNQEFMDEFDVMVREFKRGLVQEKLSQCSREQQNLFNCMYVSIDEIPEEKMRWAYGQCGRTAEENNG